MSKANAGNVFEPAVFQDALDLGRKRLEAMAELQREVFALCEETSRHWLMRYSRSSTRNARSLGDNVTVPYNAAAVNRQSQNNSEASHPWRGSFAAVSAGKGIEISPATMAANRRACCNSECQYQLEEVVNAAAVQISQIWQSRPDSL